MRLLTYDRGFGRIDGASVIRLADDAISYLIDGGTDGDRQPLDAVRAHAPVPRPGKIICVGLNYRDHAAETGKAVPTEPVIFAKFANSVVGDQASVEIPAATAEADWEAELAVVIGRTARSVSEAEALNCVGGYTCINDLSARDLQRSGGQWTRGKAIDGFLPMGPHLVTPDEVAIRSRWTSDACSTARSCRTRTPRRWCWRRAAGQHLEPDDDA